MTVAIVVPRGLEARSVRRGLGNAGIMVIEVPPGSPVEALREALDEHEGISTLYVMGTCGALDERLTAGSLVVYTSCLDMTGRRHASHAALTSSTATLLKARPVRGVTVGEIVRTAPEKRQLRARSGAAAVDLESAAILKLARERGLRCTVVRAVSDMSHVDLPDLQPALNANGDLVPGRVALAMLRSPRASLRLSVSGPRALVALRRAAAALALR